MVERNDDDMLDAFFEAGQAHARLPSGDLMARIIADADAATAEANAHAPGGVAPPRRGWRAALSALGGWAGVAGLGAATVAGLGLGLYMPDTLNTVTQGILGTEVSGYGLMDMTTSFYALAEEGGT